MAKVTKILHNKQSRAKAKQRQPNDYFFVEVSPHFVLLKVTLIGAKALCLLGAMILLSTTGFSCNTNSMLLIDYTTVMDYL